MVFACGKSPSCETISLKVSSLPETKPNPDASSWKLQEGNGIHGLFAGVSPVKQILLNLSHQTTSLLVPLYLKSGVLHTLCDLSFMSAPLSTSSDTVFRSLIADPDARVEVRPTVLPNGLILMRDRKFMRDMLVAGFWFHWRASRWASCSSFSCSRTSRRRERNRPDTSCTSGSLACMTSLNLHRKKQEARQITRQKSAVQRELSFSMKCLYVGKRTSERSSNLYSAEKYLMKETNVMKWSNNVVPPPANLQSLLRSCWVLGRPLNRCLLARRLLEECFWLTDDWLNSRCSLTQVSQAVWKHRAQLSPHLKSLFPLVHKCSSPDGKPC